METDIHIHTQITNINLNSWDKLTTTTKPKRNSKLHINIQFVFSSATTHSHCFIYPAQSQQTKSNIYKYTQTNQMIQRKIVRKTKSVINEPTFVSRNFYLFLPHKNHSDRHTLYTLYRLAGWLVGANKSLFNSKCYINQLASLR